jgi:hypothetical protein
MNDEKRDADQPLAEKAPQTPEQIKGARSQAEKLRKYERWLLIINTLAFLTLVLSVSYSSQQTRNSIKQTTRGQVIELDKQMIDNSKLRPYFYSGMEIKEDDSDDYKKSEAIAEMSLDVFDAVIEFAPVWEDPEEWDQWIIDSFAKSPLLCRYLEARQKWYDPKLMILMNRGREKAAQLKAKAETQGHQ